MAVAVGVAVLVGVAVGVTVGKAFKVKLNVQALTAAAAGLLDGTFGATAVSLVSYSLIAVNIATPARITVVNIIPIIVNLLLFIFLLSYFHPNVTWCISAPKLNVLFAGKTAGIV